MIESDLEKAWLELPSADAGAMTGIRMPGLPTQSPIYAATDTNRGRQLLVALPDRSEPLRDTATRGLEVKTEELRIADTPPRTYITLTCDQPAHYPTFSALAKNIVEAVASEPSDPRAAVARCIEHWRSFWTVDPSGLTREQALGLFGELWFLFRWMGPPTADRLRRWQGPLGSRHDFQWAEASVEVKATASPAAAAPVHLITSISQLEAPETGQLYMFSLHVADDALAANSLPKLVDLITGALNDDAETSSLFRHHLAKVGYNPAHSGCYARPLRILAEGLYRVDESFPKLTHQSFLGGLPPGVGDISYSLSMAACGAWRTAGSPSDPGAAILQA